MPEWLQIILLVVGGTAGTGGLWGAARWLAGWLDRRDQIRHDRALELAKCKHDLEAAILDRIEKLAQKFLDTNEALQRRLEDERKARLENALQHAAALAETTQRLLEAAESMRTPSSPSNPTPMTGTKG